MCETSVTQQLLCSKSHDFLAIFAVKAEISIASRLRQTQPSVFFVIVTRFLHLMVPTGLSNGISTLSLLSSH